MKRNDRGRFVPSLSAMRRFIAKCSFDPLTGCVVWTGGKTCGRGHTSPYGSFWFEGRRWFAHRWAARFIHGQEIEEQQVDHHCPDGPNTLCVHHVRAVPPAVNRELQWIRVQVGIDPPPLRPEPNANDVPFFLPPTWLVA